MKSKHPAFLSRRVIPSEVGTSCSSNSPWASQGILSAGDFVIPTRERSEQTRDPLPADQLRHDNKFPTQQLAIPPDNLCRGDGTGANLLTAANEPKAVLPPRSPATPIASPVKRPPPAHSPKSRHHERSEQRRNLIHRGCPIQSRPSFATEWDR